MTATLALSFAEATNCWAAWQWTDQPGPEAARLHPNVLAAVPAMMAGALPSASVGESPEEALSRALAGPLGHAGDTAAFVDQLADALIPSPVVLELLDRTERDGARPRLRIQPSPSLAQVPWPLLRVRLNADGSRRSLLSSIADVCLGVPQDAVRDAEPPVTGSSVVAVIDPRVPGYSASSSLGSVLGRPREDDMLAEFLVRHAGRLVPAVQTYPELVRRQDQDRAWLREALAGADRFFFLGHVSAAGVELASGASSSLHLADADDGGRHLPLSASEILADEGLRFPARVALIGCGSGTDLQYPEPMGLSLAAYLKGARLVTSAVWTLPTDALLPGEPLRRLALAVDEAHSAPDPVAALNAWQAERGEAWLDAGEGADSPLVWAAALTLVG